MKLKEAENTSFLKFLQEEHPTIAGEPFKYRKVHRNLPAAYKSVSKYDRKARTYDRAAWATAVDWTAAHFYPVMCGSRVMDYDEVTQELNMTTSCGFPWNRVFKNKEEFFTDVIARGVITDLWDSKLSQNVLWNIAQKDELRHVDKIYTNSIRTFTASPVELTHCGNRLCLDQNLKFYDSAGKTRSFVGGTKFFGGWDRLYRRLCGGSSLREQSAYELDCAAYDASQRSYTHWSNCELRLQYLRSCDRTDENILRMRNLYAQICDSYMVMENGEIIRKDGGQPSGSCNTIVDNTLTLNSVLSYAWIRYHDDAGVITTRVEFEEVVQAVLNGDDNTYTLPTPDHFFTPAVISRYASELGVEITTPCDKPRPLWECSFLSSRFRKLPDDTVVPEPETQRVLSSLMYGSSHDNVKEHLLRACALRIDSYYNETCREILGGYIAYLHKNYADFLTGTCVIGKAELSMSEILSVWKTDRFIELLFHGRESSGSDQEDHKAQLLIKILASSNDHIEDDNPKLFPISTHHCKTSPPKIILQSLKMTKTKSQKERAKAAKKGASVKAVKVPKEVKKLAKRAASIALVKGQGDYRPTRFARVAGRGDYISDVGGALGHSLGTAAGGLLSTALSPFKSILGMGDYRTRGPKHNSLHSGYPGVTNSGAMLMGSAAVKFAGGAPRVQHREYIGPIMGSNNGAFNTKVYRIQPGLEGSDVLFPWGSSVANCFQQYKLHGAILEYVTTSSNYAAQSGLGVVCMSTLYDANATPLSTLLAIDNNEFTTTSSPDKSFIHPLECGTDQSPVTIRYVRGSNSIGVDVTDDRLDDVGVFQISTNGLTAAADVQIGELWITYDIEFLKPALPDLHVGTSWMIRIDKPNIEPGPHDCFNGNVVPHPNNSLPVEIADFNKLNMPVGYNGTFVLLGTAAVDGSVYSAPFGSVSYGSDITPISLFAGPDANGAHYLSTGQDTASLMCCFAFTTIAERASENWIAINPYSMMTGGPGLTNFMSWIMLPVDNDLSKPFAIASNAFTASQLVQITEALRKAGLARSSAPSAPSRAASQSSADEETYEMPSSRVANPPVVAPYGEGRLRVR